MADNDWFSLIIVINIFLGIFGPLLGFGYSGKIDVTEAMRNSPGILTYLSYAWNVVAFYYSLIFFQVQGGTIISAIVYLINGMGVWLIVKLVRGTGG
jgi:hypothetical protein